MFEQEEELGSKEGLERSKERAVCFLLLSLESQQTSTNHTLFVSEWLKMADMKLQSTQ